MSENKIKTNNKNTKQWTKEKEEKYVNMIYIYTAFSRCYGQRNVSPPPSTILRTQGELTYDDSFNIDRNNEHIHFHHPPHCPYSLLTYQNEDINEKGEINYEEIEKRQKKFQFFDNFTQKYQEITLNHYFSTKSIFSTHLLSFQSIKLLQSFILNNSLSDTLISADIFQSINENFHFYRILDHNLQNGHLKTINKNFNEMRDIKKMIGGNDFANFHQNFNLQVSFDVCCEIWELIADFSEKEAKIHNFSPSSNSYSSPPSLKEVLLLSYSFSFLSFILILIIIFLFLIYLFYLFIIFVIIFWSNFSCLII